MEKSEILESRIRELEESTREISRRLKAAEAASETTKILSSEISLDTKIQQSIFIILEHVDADKGSLMLVDTKKGDELVVVEAATKEVGKLSRTEQLARFIKPLLRTPRFAKAVHFFEKPTGKHHRNDKRR